RLRLSSSNLPRRRRSAVQSSRQFFSRPQFVRSRGQVSQRSSFSTIKRRATFRHHAVTDSMFMALQSLALRVIDVAQTTLATLAPSKRILKVIDDDSSLTLNTTSLRQ